MKMAHEGKQMDRKEFWSGIRIAVAAFVAFATSFASAKPNYDESKVPPYTLEDPLTFVDGRKVQTKSDWRRRRDEILDVFAREMYGQPPPAPEEVVVDLFEEGATLAGLGIRRQYRMWFRKDRSGPHIDWLVLLPNRIGGQRPKKAGTGVACENGAPCPAIVFLNYYGNHELLSDPEVALSSGWRKNDKGLGITDNKTVETTRARMRRTDMRSIVPVETILARGYAVITASYGEVSPDCATRPDQNGLAWTGVFELWGARDMSRTDLPTSLGAWAWALSRGLDLAERIREIDASRCVATGSSRLGKAALLAAARDERFAACVANQTGLGGVPLTKRFFGANVATETKSFPHWYCKAYFKYAGNEQSMPFDQHLLLACIAPRALLVEGFNHGWFDPKGEFLAVKAASPVWKFLGADALPDGDNPADYSTELVGKSLGYVRRGGKHGLSAYDWLWLLDFADKALADVGKSPVWPLQERIDAIAANGGGTLTLTAGVYRTGALFFKPGVNLHLEKGATILGVDEAEGYPMQETRIMGETCLYYPALINADRCDGFTITGEGVIDGHGANTWEEFWTRRAEARKAGKQFHDKALMRPRVLYVSRSRNIDISGVTFKNSKFWTTHFYDCDDVVVHDCTILADILKDSKGHSLKGPSTDAIDIDKCRRFTVRNVDVSVNDDGVVVKGGKGPWADDYKKFPENGPSTDVLVEGCTFRYPTHSALTLGSECPAATNVTIRNCVMDGCGDLLRLKMRTDTPQHYSNVLVETCRGKCNTLLRAEAWSQFHDPQGRSKPELKSYADGVTLKGNNVKVRHEKIWKKDDSVFEVTNIKMEDR